MCQLCRFFACAALLGCSAETASAVELFSDNFNALLLASMDDEHGDGRECGYAAGRRLRTTTCDGDSAKAGIVDTLGLALGPTADRGGVEVTTRPAGVLSGLSLSPTARTSARTIVVVLRLVKLFRRRERFGPGRYQWLRRRYRQCVFLRWVRRGPCRWWWASRAWRAPRWTGLDLPDHRRGRGAGLSRTQTGTVSTAGTGIYAAEATLDPDLSPLAAEHAFYAPLFPSQSAPAVQLDLSAAEYPDANNTQLGTTPPGSFGFKWHKVVISKDGGSVTWDIDDADRDVQRQRVHPRRQQHRDRSERRQWNDGAASIANFHSVRQSRGDRSARHHARRL